MPLIFPGSSENVISELTPLPVQSSEVQDKLAALSLDEPLPEVYIDDQIRLLAQSPYKLFLYWNHARDPIETLHKAFGANDASSYQLALRLVDEESGEERLFQASPARNYWFDVRPDRRYSASVGFFAQGRPFIRLLSSELIRTPRASVSPQTDDAPEFHATSPEFAQVLNEAGYTSDALQVTLEAADEASHDTATRSLAYAFTGSEAPLSSDDQLAEMRALLAALAFGESLERLLPLLSPSLASWLQRVVKNQEEKLQSARLLEILYSALAVELEDDERFDTTTPDAPRRAARFVWGASDVQMPTMRKASRLWMPSMNESFSHWRQKASKR